MKKRKRSRERKREKIEEMNNRGKKKVEKTVLLK